MSNMSEFDICVGELMKTSQSLKTIADSLISVAEVILVCAHEPDNSPDSLPQKHTISTITLEQIRTVLAEKSGEGKRKEVKELLFKYDAGKLSGVNPVDYPLLMEEAMNL